MAGLARVLLSAIALAAAPARADGPICGPHPRAWDKDHALIEEAQLTPEAAADAKKHIAMLKKPPPDAPGELEILAAAGEAIIQGYRLRQDYERSPSPAAKRRFCEWMRDRAYWPE